MITPSIGSDFAIISQRAAQAFFEADLRFPAEFGFDAAVISAVVANVDDQAVLREGHVFNFAFRHQF